MENFKKTIGENLAKLRKDKKMTQAELADKFHYSDKAVSKWEKGDTLPDLEVIYELCEYYGVTIDYLTHTENQEQFKKEKDPIDLRNKLIILNLLLVTVWMIATIIYVYLLINNSSSGNREWLSFVWATPASMLVLLWFNRRNFKNKILRVVSLSVLLWALLASLFLQFLDQLIWPIFLIGIPMQAIIILFNAIRKNK